MPNTCWWLLKVSDWGANRHLKDISVQVYKHCSWIRENPKWFQTCARKSSNPMLNDPSTLETEEFKEIIKSPKWAWHSCPWWVGGNVWPQHVCPVCLRHAGTVCLSCPPGGDSSNMITSILEIMALTGSQMDDASGPVWVCGVPRFLRQTRPSLQVSLHTLKINPSMKETCINLMDTTKRKPWALPSSNATCDRGTWRYKALKTNSDILEINTNQWHFVPAFKGGTNKCNLSAPAGRWAQRIDVLFRCLRKRLHL